MSIIAFAIVRTTLLTLAFVLAACGREDRTDTADTSVVSDAPSAGSISGPDHLVLRFPRNGGVVRAFAYPRLDSVVWQSRDSAPAITRVLAFDGNAGSVVAEDAKGTPVRVDLRVGRVSRDPGPKLTKLSSSDGSAVYGIRKTGSVTRLTPVGNWTFKPPRPARDIFPQPDGSVLVLADADSMTVVWQMFPPDTNLVDTAVVPHVERAIGTQVGDRLYLTVDSGLIALRSRDLSLIPRVRIQTPVRSVVTTPSGDRIYVATDSSRELIVVNRYNGEVEAEIALPGVARELRMDPTGRYVLAHPVGGDSAWVIAVGTDRVIGTAQTTWRSDLPAVAPDGAIGLLRGKDVVLVDGETLRPRRSIAGGARDQWHFIAWNGFRPRAAGLDEPVEFPEDENPVDSALRAEADTAPQKPPAGQQVSTPPAAADSARRPAQAAADSARRTAAGFTVQFGALRSQPAAHELARSIRVEGASPRVVTTVTGGISIYRVVVGPFATRAQAERVAQTSNRSFWIYEGTP